MLSEKENAAHDTSIKSGDQEQAPETPGQVQCSVCRSTFRRPEHLKRYLRSHTKEKPFECIQCGRHFSRTDTLHRHEVSHHAPGGEGGKDRSHRITVKTFRACFSCAAARVRCSGGMPCGRCGARSLECQYPTERRSKARAREEGLRSLASAETQETGLQTRRPSQASDTHLKPVRADLSGQFKLSSDIQSSGLDISNPDLHLSHADQALDETTLFFDGYDNGDGHQPFGQGSTPNILKQFSESIPDLDSMTTSNVDLEMAMADNPERSLGLNPTLFDQSMLSITNWLPNDLFAPSDQTQSRYDQSLLSDASMDRSAW
ncbi:hypothetical protein NUU61_004004 [Penicillium alfredii]|uniref:Uncharacterized protein n=1 Tax=Penicillium alfredii TaxID=1506179 RepID=A0A9W9FKU3_9EURO|nr:uncharacterized protein NUU61_004004 [Penicillium alfredii]KAJ5101782.1 hypothetical protein NUU61_004004 [Penicillium alfredii]